MTLTHRSSLSTGGSISVTETRTRSKSFAGADPVSPTVTLEKNLADSLPGPGSRRMTGLSSVDESSSAILNLVISVGGIYASFLTWAVLQERISTTPYGPERLTFRYSLVINTVQSFCAAVVGLVYTIYTSHRDRTSASVFPNSKIFFQYGLVATTSSLASPFGYASLDHIDYLTLLLGKSCKLLPVMLLHVVLFRRKYSWSKYAVVFAVTFGVSMFTIYQPTNAAKVASSSNRSSSSLYGLFLLSINLLFDGLTNSTQDHIFQTQPSISGPKMMCGINVMATVLTTLFLLSPLSTQLADSIQFFRLYPAVLRDILLFSLCGAIGQIFIFFTLSKFGSLTLVTVTVTRKMMSMLLSVIWFNHKLSLGQWFGVLLVFGGVGGEALTKYIDSKKKVLVSSSSSSLPPNTPATPPTQIVHGKFDKPEKVHSL
ncbi:UAA transporter family-domain-containing protein [Lipomyces oligophaga]|uniref:UAA transporter family-domain-containing protein n=1 Tax=Lipomyces oligophaga TaxID=45792 RepID=UPI0034CDCFA5